MSATERYERRKTLVDRRIAIRKQWQKLHPEGINAKNLEDFRIFMKCKEKEVIDD